MEAIPQQAAGTALAALVALPFVASLATSLADRMGWLRRRPWLPALSVALLCLAGFSLLRTGREGPAFSLPWIDEPPIAFALRLDGLAFLYAILVTGLGALVVVYSSSHLPTELHEHRSRRRQSTFYAYLLFFLGSMLGVVCADELLTLYVFWEATSISSFLLIGLHLHEARPRAAAIQAFTITAGAGLLLFLAFLFVGRLLGTTSIPGLAGAGEAIAESPLAIFLVTFTILGAAAKSALAPLHFWLPPAMVAPTPASAYLHSATMVAAGVFLLARLSPLLAEVPGFRGALVAVGAATMMAGGIVASVRNRLKEILAWSTISQYGYVALLLGMHAWGAALFLVGIHALLKAGLFLVVGVVVHATGESDLRRLGGLYRRMPWTTASACLLSLGLAGIPFTSGFWMKELFYEAAVEEGVPWIVTVSIAAGTLTFVYSFRFFWRTFVSGRTPEPLGSERTFPSQLLPVLLLALLAVVFGLFPGWAAAFTDPAASAAAAAPVASRFALHWPPGRALLASLCTFVLGIGLFVWLERRERAFHKLPSDAFPHPTRRAVASGALAMRVIREIGPRKLWEWFLPALDAAGRFLARSQTGRLVHYLLFLVAVPALFGLLLLPQVETWPEMVPPEEIDQTSIAFGALALAAVGLAITSALVHSHIAAILMVGGVGFVLALVFSMLRAPDVALVQVAVETVSALLLLIVLSRIRVTIREEAIAPVRQRSRPARIGAVLGAGAAAISITATLLAVGANPGDPSLGKSFFPAAEALEMDGVVTAILVDYRGFDTLGEATVFAAGTLGALLLLSGAPQRVLLRPTWHPATLNVTTRLTFPVVLVFAAELIVNATVAPGEGFSAGVLTAMSVLLLYVGLGYGPVERELPFFGRWGLATGISLLLGSAVFGLFTERRSFLASAGPHSELFGETLHLTTHALFDLGIFFVVATGVIAIFRAIGRRKEMP